MFYIRDRPVKTDILRIHAEDAAFILRQRSLACEAPNYRLEDMFDLEQRLMGHLDSIALSKEAGLEIAQGEVDRAQAADSLAVLFHVSIRNGERHVVERICDLVPRDDKGCEYRQRLGEAASWCKTDDLSQFMSDWINSKTPLLRWIALEVCGIHRVDPNAHLDRMVADDDALVRERAIRLVGELGRADLLERILEIGGDEADLTAVLLGDDRRARRLGQTTTFPRGASMARRFAETMPIVLGHGPAMDAISALVGNAATRRWGIVAIGALGWAGAIPSLLKLMQGPEHARVAVSAFEQISGLYVAHVDLELDDFPDAPIDQDLEVIEDFADTNTPWPDLDKFSKWVDQNSGRFASDQRLLLGLPAWTFSGHPDASVKYQARHRWIAITQALAMPAAMLPNWASPVSLKGGTFERKWSAHAT